MHMYTGYQVHIARNICCNVIENTIRGHTPYCASEICHFRLMEENISNNRDIWTENTLKQAMAGLLHVSAGAPFILGSLSLPPRICANVALSFPPCLKDCLGVSSCGVCGSVCLFLSTNS